MPELEHSKRSVERATYTPIKAARLIELPAGRAWDKWSYFAGFASAAGSEDQAVRLIKNPFADKATRVDYYQLVRKWRVDLYRYGLRMTYDLTIPEPGSDILSRIVEIKSLTSALSEGFGSTTSTLPWARFDLTPQQITRFNYLALAAQYGVMVESPPVEEIMIARAFTRNWPNKDSANDSDYTTFDVDVPEGYLVSGWSYEWQRWAWTDEDWHFDIRPRSQHVARRWRTLDHVGGHRCATARGAKTAIGEARRSKDHAPLPAVLTLGLQELR